jgi:hypothetical protein
MDTAGLGRTAITLALLVIALLPSAGRSQAAPASQIDDNIVVQITSPQPSQRLAGRVTITGYAADRRSVDGSGLNERDIQFFLNDSSDERNRLAYTELRGESPAAAATLGSQFIRSGFSIVWETCSFPAGSYKLIVWASSLVELGARNFASVDVDVEPCLESTILVQRDAQLPRPYALPETFADFAVGIDARCPPSDPECNYRLTVRQQLPSAGPGSGTSYSFIVDPVHGTYGLQYTAPGNDAERFVWIVPPARSPLVRRGTEVNRLAVIAQGDWLRLFINGEQVGEGHDQHRPWGSIAWVSWSAADRHSIEGWFANLIVSKPGPLETLRLVLRGTP